MSNKVNFKIFIDIFLISLTSTLFKTKLNDLMMINLMNIFSIMPDLVKDSSIQSKFGLKNENTDLDDDEKRIMEAEFTEKELNEFMTKDNSKPENETTAEMKHGKKYSNFFVLQSGLQSH